MSTAKDPSVKISKCYIATAVYGSYDAPEVLVLRRFRDEVLSKSLPGRAFIRTYYKVSPPAARHLENAGLLSSIVRRILDEIVKWVSRGNKHK
ncbi:MAG: CFI-box-CTERM domain-containing protein [Eubacteriales bacterium]